MHWNLYRWGKGFLDWKPRRFLFPRCQWANQLTIRLQSETTTLVYWFLPDKVLLSRWTWMGFSMKTRGMKSFVVLGGEIFLSRQTLRHLRRNVVRVQPRTVARRPVGVDVESIAVHRANRVVPLLLRHGQKVEPLANGEERVVNLAKLWSMNWKWGCRKKSTNQATSSEVPRNAYVDRRNDHWCMDITLSRTIWVLFISPCILHFHHIQFLGSHND